MEDEDFIARALSSLSSQMALANAAGGGGDGVLVDNSTLNQEIEAHAKSLVDNDIPKIESAVKSFLSLVAARSAVASEIDVLSENVKSIDEHVKLNSMEMKSALSCARTLLKGINSTVIPKRNGKGDENDESDDKNNQTNDDNQQIMNAATLIVWDRLVENEDMKPSKVLGRKSLIVTWPYIRERFRRGVESDECMDDDFSRNADNLLSSFSKELLPAIAPPQGIEKDDWIAYYTEFGSLLKKACQNDESKPDQDVDNNEDDSKLVWSHDKGVSELQQRRDRRMRRAEVLTQGEKVTEEE
jgi:hypothetical protein